MASPIQSKAIVGRGGPPDEFLPSPNGDPASSIAELIDIKADPVTRIGERILSVKAELLSTLAGVKEELWDTGSKQLRLGEKVNEAKRERGTYLRQFEDTTLQPNQRDVTRLDGVIDAAVSAHAASHSAGKELGKQRAALEDVVPRTLDYALAELRRPKPALKVLPEVELPGNVLSFLEKVRGKLEALDGEEAGIRNTPGDFEEGIAAINAKLQRRARTIMLNESNEPVWPSTVKGDEDTLGLLLNVESVREAIAAPAFAELARRCKEAGKTYTVAARKAALADVRALRLDLAREEVAAIRYLRTKGHRVMYRAGTDPRAMLGVSGPAPEKRR